MVVFERSFFTALYFCTTFFVFLYIYYITAKLYNQVAEIKKIILIWKKINSQGDFMTEKARIEQVYKRSRELGLNPPLQTFNYDLHKFALEKYSHLPIIVDPSHGTGQRYLIEPMSKAALVAGANGIMMEVHHDPQNASCDGAQSLSIPQFKDMIKRVNKLIGRIDYDNKLMKEGV